MSQSVLRSRNVEIEPSSAYLIEDRPRAPQSTRSGLTTSEHLVLERLANAAGANHDLDLRNIGIGLGLFELLGDGVL